MQVEDGLALDEDASRKLVVTGRERGDGHVDAEALQGHGNARITFEHVGHERQRQTLLHTSSVTSIASNVSSKNRADRHARSAEPTEARTTRNCPS
jgi:hypothetical protein